MRGKSMILIVIALGCGLVASIGISQILDRSGDAKSVTIETKKIFVAVRDVDISEVVDANMVHLEEWPASKIPEGSITNIDEVEGLSPNQRLYAGEPIRKAKLVDPHKRGGESLRITKGYRVQAVKVKSEDVVGNLISPGDHVDVQVYLRKGSSIPLATTKTILQDVRVFAVNSETSKQLDEDGNKINAKTVSLLVKPQQLQTLLLASRLGQISLSLRHPDDDSGNEAADGADLTDLINGNAEDATPDQDLLTAQNHDGSAKGSATDLNNFLNGLTSSAAGQSDQLAQSAWRVQLLTPDGVVTYEVIDDASISEPQVVDGKSAELPFDSNAVYGPNPASDPTTHDDTDSTGGDGHNSDSDDFG